MTREEFHRVRLSYRAASWHASRDSAAMLERGSAVGLPMVSPYAAARAHCLS